MMWGFVLGPLILGSSHVELGLGGVFLAPFFCFGARFVFFVGGWCRLELCQFCKLWQEKC